MREAHIAADLGISRSPLREALTRLEEEGLVVKIPFRGAFVVEVSARDVAEIASVRLRVEPLAGELSMATLRDRERAHCCSAPWRISAWPRRRKTSRPASTPTSASTGSSTTSPDHTILQDLWNGWESKLRLYLAVDHRSYSDMHEIASEHEGLVSAVLDGDVERFQRRSGTPFPVCASGP